MSSAITIVPCELPPTYAVETRALSVRAVRILAVLGLLSVPPFLWIDAMRFPELSGALIPMRLALLVSAVLVLALLATRVGRAWPELLAVGFALASGAISIALMAPTGGHESSHFAGVGLSMLLTALVMPWGTAWTALTCSLLVVLYVVASGALGFGLQGNAIRGNLAAAAVMMGIAVFASASRERLRRREFTARWTLERNAAQLKENARAATVLAQAGREMLRVLDTPHILDRLCQLTRQALGCDVSHTAVHDAAADCWKVVAHDGNTPEQWELIRGIRVLGSQVPNLVRRLREEGAVQLSSAELSRPGSPLERAAQAGITRSLLVGLYAGDELIGIQGAGFRGRTEPFTDEQVRLAIAMAQLASFALANARLYDELARQSAAERAARAAAERASRAKDDFLATLSHELRTPLNVILGYLDILADPEVDLAERDAIVGRATRTSRQLYYMITDTLEISRLHAGRTGPQLELLELPELWRQLRAECETLPRHAATELVWDADAPDVTLATDRRMVLVIVRNLVSNALKFTERGTVRVAARVVGGHLELEVADSGIGIPEEEKSRIFEMFQQVESAEHRRHGGVGLGLYIVQRFAAQLGAEVDVESTVGAGSVFRVRLPLEHRGLATCCPGRG